MDDDPFSLRRFVKAQAPVYDEVLAELRAGRKRGHWMWFIFPQLAGLGRSDTARFFAIGSLEEARAYLAHPLLGARLRECAALAAAAPARKASDIFPYPDDLKFHSCLTLFSQAEAGSGGIFAACLQKYFDGEPDPASVLPQD
ncbi:DUF1810 domain-containing protein [Noviherbaspirillum aridicola]|uniref:Calpastatin n=1 Tax=Noviherbaspirillum aridicola TaxID=2849687 RepID=A0ABQ4Q029_9BURK|nr:DUF1810 domain-containing protein [Noviherbaspirillum aridicola]GIZ50498.1 hypothetical protein NCCP691_05120 [Noviherbaspirillum aridicola]